MSTANKLFQAASGGASDPVYVEDVFSTHLYTGTGSGITINNGIDLAGEGGLVIYRRRDGAENWSFQDTVRGVDSVIYSDSTNAAADPGGYGLASFNSNGFTTELNTSSAEYCSWTFRKQAGFFDIQTWTGNSTAGRTISHDLGSVPGMIIIKSTSAAGEPWYVYHRETDSSAPEDYHTLLNSTAARADSVEMMNDTAPTATEFSVSQYNSVNGSGKTYIAYLFGHDEQSYGDNSDEAIIKCGSYTGNGSTTGPEINLGFEPQLLMIKASSGSTGNWYMYDSMRGLTAISSNDAELYPSSSGAEYAGRESINVTATGFQLATTNTANNANGSTYIYIAIRRPMKTPEAGTDVFSPYAYSDTGLTSGSGTASNRTIINGGSNGGSGFPVDLFMHKSRNNSSYGVHVFDRIRGQGASLLTNSTAAEPAGDGASNSAFDFQEGVDAEYNGVIYYYTSAAGGRTHITYHLKRATGFLDVVAYVADQTSTHAHNLGVTPEFAIIKQRNGTNAWKAYHSYLGNNQYLQPHTTNAAATDTGWASVNASTFFLKANNGNNIAYLFATVTGVSKVGSVVHSGTTDVDCGFSAGARFVLIKRTDSTGDWYYWDSLRGIIAGNDPYLLLNSSAVEVTNTDYIDPLNAGFTLTSSFTAGTYIFLAIA